MDRDQPEEKKHLRKTENDDNQPNTSIASLTTSSSAIISFALRSMHVHRSYGVNKQRLYQSPRTLGADNQRSSTGAGIVHVVRWYRASTDLLHARTAIRIDSFMFVVAGVNARHARPRALTLEARSALQVCGWSIIKLLDRYRYSSSIQSAVRIL